VRMRCLAIGVMLAAGVGTGPSILAQTPQNPQNPHIGHVMDRFFDTPEEMGLLPVALAEAKVALQHAGLAAGTPEDLGAMQRHAGHVLHAVDPSVEASGPGLGYGVRRAAAGVARHIGLAAGTEGASDNIKTHAQHVTAAANTVVTRADAIVALVARIRAAESASAAAPLVSQLATLAGQLLSGTDADGDGAVSWREGEGGLEQVQQHMDLMRRGEGG